MIIILMGVSGSGKSTIGNLLAEELSWPFYEGDEFHPRANIEKMSKGIGLTDADRAPWLAAIAQLIRELDTKSSSGIIACSALKQSYRDVLARDSASVRFVYLKGSYELIQQRMLARHGHFMKADMLKSQFETLEEPRQAFVADIAQTPEKIVRQIRKGLNV